MRDIDGTENGGNDEEVGAKRQVGLRPLLTREAPALEDTTLSAVISRYAASANYL